MAAAGGTWSKGKFYPAEAKQLAQPQTQQKQVLDDSTRRSLLGEGARQGGMFEAGEDSPLFTGTAQRGEISQFKATTQARQENFAGMAEDKGYQSRRDAYTRQYWQAKSDYEEAQQIAKEIEEQENDPYLAKQVRDEARDKLRDEEKLSGIARENGYDPYDMTPRDWDRLAEDLEDQAAQDLANSTDERRAAKANKARGPKELGMIGGQDAMIRTGAVTAKDAQQMQAEAKRSAKERSEDYMGDKLREYGYSNDDLEGSSYDQKRRLLAEISHGIPQKARIGQVDRDKRENVISDVSDKQKLEAGSIAASPETGKGLETWEYYRLAKEKAGKEPDYVPDELYNAEIETAPQYVKRPQGSKSVRLQRQERFSYAAPF